MRKSLKKVFACIPLVLTLAGCKARASANVVFNNDSTVSVEQLLLIRTENGEEADFGDTYSALVPSPNYEYATREETSNTIQGEKYTGYHTATYDLDMDDYASYLNMNSTKDYAFKPNITITGSGITKTATLSCTDYLSSGSQKVDLDGVSLKVNVTLPSSVKAESIVSNATSVSDDGMTYTWENEDIDDMSISFNYIDLSGPVGIAASLVLIAIFGGIVFGITDAMTKPGDPKKITYKV